MGEKIRIFILITLSFLLSSCVGVKLSDKTWLSAFDEMHQIVSRSYPFIEWKKLDMDSLYNVTSERIKVAQAQQNKEAYYLALRQYAFSFPDGHVFIAGNDFGLREKNIAGSYGLGLMRLHDGTYIVHYVAESGPAVLGGMKWGAVVKSWNGTAIDEAVKNTSLLWAERQKATAEGRFLEQCRYLTRAPLGSKSMITFKNPGDKSELTISLKTYDDGMADLEKSAVSDINPAALMKTQIEYRVMPEHVGYIKINKFMPSLTQWGLYSEFKEALAAMIEANVHGVIIDVRGNEGGLDALVPQMCGHFVQDTSLYEHVSYYDTDVDSFVLKPDETLTITPVQPYFPGTIVVLVDNNSISTAEGLPMVVKRLPNGHVMGQYGTAGSFAVDLPKIFRLPEDVVFGFSPGRSLDENMNIQIDSDSTGSGGVHPDIRIPVTYDLAYQQYLKNTDVLLQEAVRYIRQIIKR